MTARKPNFNIDVLYLARKDELSEGGRYGYLRAIADVQPRIDALVAALQKVARNSHDAACPDRRDRKKNRIGWEECPEPDCVQARAALKRVGKE